MSESLKAVEVKLIADHLAAIWAAVLACSIAGTRYAAQMMTYLDSERNK